MIIQSPTKDYEDNQKSTWHKEEFQVEKKSFQKELENMGKKKSPVYLKQGPVQERKIRDVFCIIVFLSIIAFQVFVFITKQLHDINPFEALSKPYDYDHQQCGGSTRKGYPYIYFVAPTSQDSITRTVCVKECPKNIGKNPAKYHLECYPNSTVPSCNYNKSNDIQKQVLIYESYHYSARVCLPAKLSYFNEVSQTIDIDDIDEYIYNIQTALPLIILSAVLSLVIGFTLFWFLNYFPQFITWFFLCSIMLFSGLVGYQLFFRARNGFVAVQDKDQYSQKLRNTSLGEDQNPIIMYTGAGVCWTISFCVMMLMVIYYKKVKNLTNMLRISSKYAQVNWSIYFLPIFQFIFMISYLVFCLILIVEYFKIETPTENDHMPFKRIVLNQSVYMKISLQVFMFLIIARFLISIGDFIIQTSACLWYYQNEHHETGKSHTWQALKWSIRYQMGSLFFFAFLNTIFAPIRSVLNFFYYLIIPFTFKKNNTYSYYLSTCIIYSCCCFDKAIIYITDHAYVWMAMTGEGYMQSAVESYYLTKRNHHRLEEGENVNKIFRVLGKLFLCLTSTFVGVFLMYRLEAYNTKITNFMLPIGFMAILSYTIGHFFIDIYASSSDALLLVSFIDEEVELEHYGKEFVYNCPSSIRPYISQLHKNKNSKIHTGY